MIRRDWQLPPSPIGLLQEQVWQNEWLVLVACVLLNRTTRKQVDLVFPTFREKWHTPELFLAASEDEVAELCKPLGFANRRTVALRKLATAYMAGCWQHAGELPGIGEYGARAWEIFCRGQMGNEPPKDHSLVKLWRYYKDLGLP